MRAPFRADQVGSLLRPAALLDARRKWQLGEISKPDLARQEDAAIREAVARQEDIGLESITDGEFRREWWHLDFLKQLDGVTLRENPGPRFVGSDEQPPIATVTDRVRCGAPIMADHFAFLKSATRRSAKLTIPSPGMLHLRGGRAAISREVYPDLAEFWADVSAAYRQAIGHFATAGCTYLQMDDVGFAYLCDTNFRESCRRNGDDPDTLPRQYVSAINDALKDRPKNMAVTLHTCHGNFRSTWATEGGYDAVAETLFDCAIDGFFMEFDSERSGSFTPLRYLPRNKKVVLGLVTSKLGRIESRDEIRRRIDAAAEHVPLENLCLSPQCGFASSHHGNTLSQDDQWRKLELIVSVAREVWGTAA